MGCISVVKDKETVIQKSKQETPAWIFTSKDIVFKRNDIYNLNLGIKQVQNAALLQYKTAVPKDIYWEYREKETNNGSERYYTIWVLLSVLK